MLIDDCADMVADDINIHDEELRTVVNYGSHCQLFWTDAARNCFVISGSSFCG